MDCVFGIFVALEHKRYFHLASPPLYKLYIGCRGQDGYLYIYAYAFTYCVLEQVTPSMQLYVTMLRNV